MRAFVSVLVVLGLSGCATVFSGTSQHVSIKAAPADTTIVVLGGPIGAGIAKVGRVAEIQRRVLTLLFQSDAEEYRQFIATVGLEGLITRILLEVKLGQPPTDLTDQAGQIYSRIPRLFKERLVQAIGLEAFGVGQVEARLQRGEIYAVIGWRLGSNIRIRAIDSTLNWTTLWNILNLGIGYAVDLYTGAWTRLTPTNVELTLDPLPAKPL